MRAFGKAGTLRDGADRPFGKTWIGKHPMGACQPLLQHELGKGEVVMFKQAMDVTRAYAMSSRDSPISSCVRLLRTPRPTMPDNSFSPHIDCRGQVTDELRVRRHFRGRCERPAAQTPRARSARRHIQDIVRAKIAAWSRLDVGNVLVRYRRWSSRSRTGSALVRWSALPVGRLRLRPDC